MIYDVIEVNGKEKKEGYLKDLIRNIVCDGEGDVACGVKFFETEDGGKFIALGIGQLDESVGVGNLPKQEKLKASVIWAFNNEKSIDVVITWLNDAKQMLANKANHCDKVEIIGE